MLTVSDFTVILVLRGMSPLYLYATFPTYTRPFDWLLNHFVLLNAFSQTVSRLLENLIFSSFIQPLKAENPIVVTPFGMVTLVIIPLSLNAPVSICFTVWPLIAEGMDKDDAIPS